MDFSKNKITELHLSNLEGDSFTIDENITKLFVYNCPDFKTVPAHIIELNVRNCASFKSVPKTVKYLEVYNCPLYVPNKASAKQEAAMALLQDLRKYVKLINPKLKLHLTKTKEN